MQSTNDDINCSMQDRIYCVLYLENILHDDPIWLNILEKRNKCLDRLILEKLCFGKGLILPYYCANLIGKMSSYNCVDVKDLHIKLHG